MVDSIKKEEGMEYLLKMEEVLEIWQKIKCQLTNLQGGLYVV